MNQVASDPAPVWGRYEEFKTHRGHTLTRCTEQGLGYMPLVIEAVGRGLGPVARRVCAFVASPGAAHEGEEVGVQAVSLLRCISISLQR